MPRDVLLDEVSTKTILVPLFCTFSSSGSRAAESVGATSSAAGLVTSASAISGSCSGTLNSDGPLTVR